jgi:hypothetical protein
MATAATFPRHRPPLVLRALIALVALGALAFNAALMLSDRAPGLLRRVFGDSVQRLSARIDASERLADLAARAGTQVPESDAIVHVAVWAVAALLVGLTVWSWVGLLFGSAVVLGASAVVELAQGRLTDTRAVEASDLAANALGVAAGTVAAGACYVLWSAFAVMLGPRR